MLAAAHDTPHMVVECAIARRGPQAVWQVSRGVEFEGFWDGRSLSRKSCSMPGIAEEIRYGEQVELASYRAKRGTWLWK